MESREVGGLPKFRRKVLKLYRKFLPKPHGSLLLGIVLGTKSGLEKGFFESLRKTGTLHIVVASGRNITIFAGSILNGLAVFIGRRKAIILVLRTD